jgi:hypothetical protein
MAENEREKRKEKTALPPPDSEEESDAEDASCQHKEALQLAKDIMDELDFTVPNMIAFNDGKTQFLLITIERWHTIVLSCVYIGATCCFVLTCLFSWMDFCMSC